MADETLSPESAPAPSPTPTEGVAPAPDPVVEAPVAPVAPSLADVPAPEEGESAEVPDLTTKRRSAT
jgi:hypothetical protein